jgi:hypothetical protein
VFEKQDPQIAGGWGRSGSHAACTFPGSEEGGRGSDRLAGDRADQPGGGLPSIELRLVARIGSPCHGHKGDIPIDMIQPLRTMKFTTCRNRIRYAASRNKGDGKAKKFPHAATLQRESIKLHLIARSRFFDIPFFSAVR